MSRKLRFFRDQVGKAGIMSPENPVVQPDVVLEELEVLLGLLLSSSLQPFYSILLDFNFLRDVHCARFFLSNFNTSLLPDSAC